MKTEFIRILIDVLIGTAAITTAITTLFAFSRLTRAYFLFAPFYMFVASLLRMVFFNDGYDVGILGCSLSVIIAISYIIVILKDKKDYDKS